MRVRANRVQSVEENMMRCVCDYSENYVLVDSIKYRISKIYRSIIRESDTVGWLMIYCVHCNHKHAYKTMVYCIIESWKRLLIGDVCRLASRVIPCSMLHHLRMRPHRHWRAAVKDQASSSIVTQLPSRQASSAAASAASLATASAASLAAAAAASSSFRFFASLLLGQSLWVALKCSVEPHLHFFSLSRPRF